MRKTIPRVVYDGLSRPGRFYVVLRYTLKGTSGDASKGTGRVTMIAHEKYDVTDDVLRAVDDYKRDRPFRDRPRPHPK